MNKERWKSLLAEYGSVALWTYFGIFFLVLLGFVLAIQLGFEVESTGGGAGVLGAAYIATKLTQPIRIGVTLVLTPVVARVVRRVRGGSVEAKASVKATASVEDSSPDASG